ncbi:MGH1-like glycoside hydrolase domain-containing protein [Actinomadura gamaensis]|uniref:Mannosylglycerate hydrolase MGH1-like glycoside hydrolase domain-containing protein n=1 Tax=Actinomadura gamaensis TaxID=1763541 RepID=A0ABV9TRI7_9ACTN
MSSRLTGDETALWQAAARVLDANWTGTATVPSPGLYPHQWSLDSAFVALGLARHRRDRAERELTSLFRGQWADGLLPHLVFDDTLARHAYFPGPEMWHGDHRPRAPHGVRTSGLTQPPLHAFAALRLHESAPPSEAEHSLDFLRGLYPCLAAQHRYLAEARDLSGSGLAAICHPWESGMDNSPAWDRPLGALRLPPAAYSPGRTPRDLPTGEDYDRYVHLVALLRAHDYEPAYIRDDHPFAVEDPLFNAAYLASEHALAEIAALVGADPAPHRERSARVHAALLDRLWDHEQGCFRARDLRDDRLLPVVTVAAFAPLLDPDLPPGTVRRLVDLLLSARFAGAAGYPVPTCDIQAPAFDRSGYWRGPTWINTNWLLWHGALGHGLTVVADLLYGSTLRLVRQSGFREYFDPFDGTGRGSHDYSWSAALVLDLLAARRAPRAA